MSTELGGGTPRPVLGVLGGMGPAATVDFLAKLTRHTTAHRDQDHLSTVVYSDPSTPDRTEAILGGGPSPLPAMLHGVRFLAHAAATLIAIPCNTAHVWFSDLQRATTVEIVSIVEATVGAVVRDRPRARRIGLLATDATVRTRLYARSFAEVGRRTIDLGDLGTRNPVMAGIRALKAGDAETARERLHTAAGELVSRGAQALVYACTDVSAALDAHPPPVAVPVHDAADALAISCLRRLDRRSGLVEPVPVDRS